MGSDIKQVYNIMCSSTETLSIPAQYSYFVYFVSYAYYAEAA